jgi:hypothetical protein
LLLWDLICSINFHSHRQGNALRTPEVEGITDTLPVVGEPFIMYGKSLNTNAGIRRVSTNIVVEIIEEDPIVFKTASGTIYKITKVD